MGKWLDMARREEEPPRAVSVFSADSSGDTAKDAKDTKGRRTQAPHLWRTHLARLDPDEAPAGYSDERWGRLIDDAVWLFQNFAGQAARDGWSAYDLFGLLPHKDGWGGLADRLRGARNLKMDQDRAVWSIMGIRDQFCRGGGDDLVSSGLVLIWEAER